MDWMNIWWDLLLSVLGVVVTWVAGRLGGLLRVFWQEKITSSTLRDVAKTCVSAVEMMYRDAKGEEKLKEALALSGEILRNKGISVADEELRVMLEAALAELKGAFQGA
jgi:uncharacterized protein YneF (UPF0154 family)